MKYKIPIALIIFRFIIGLAVIVLSAIQISNYIQIAILFFTIGLLTDIFDGIIARQLNVSTQRLRRLDSSVDQVFFISFAIATYIQCPDFFKTNTLKLTVLFGIEALTYLISFIKFKKKLPLTQSEQKFGAYSFSLHSFK
ncbi:MAG: CDP-alcohol phosphatidyltransferase family protein [Ginsengibacter sp.]